MTQRPQKGSGSTNHREANRIRAEMELSIADLSETDTLPSPSTQEEIPDRYRRAVNLFNTYMKDPLFVEALYARFGESAQSVAAKVIVGDGEHKYNPTKAMRLFRREILNPGSFGNEDEELSVFDFYQRAVTALGANQSQKGQTRRATSYVALGSDVADIGVINGRPVAIGYDARHNNPLGSRTPIEQLITRIERAKEEYRH